MYNLEQILAFIKTSHDFPKLVSLVKQQTIYFLNVLGHL